MTSVNAQPFLVAAELTRIGACPRLCPLTPLLVAAIFTGYFGCMALLLAYIARTARPEDPGDGGDRDEHAEMLAAWPTLRLRA